MKCAGTRRAGNLHAACDAADLDLDKIESILPEMKKRARDMQAEGDALTGHPGLPLKPTPNLVTN